MQARSNRAVAPSVLLVTGMLAFGAAAVHAAEMKGKAILAHPCGKVAVENMGLVHDGKMEESLKLGTKAMQAEWAAIPKDDKEMMVGMMKEMSVTREAHSAAIEKFGTLVVDGKAATLTILKEIKDENGSSTETMSQKFEINGDVCLITR